MTLPIHSFRCRRLRFGSLVGASLDRHRHHDACVLEYLSYTVADFHHSVVSACRPNADGRKDIPRPLLDGRLHQQVGENLVDGNRHGASLTVLLRLLRDFLYYRADDVHLRPRELAAVAEAPPPCVSQGWLGISDGWLSATEGFLSGKSAAVCPPLSVIVSILPFPPCGRDYTVKNTGLSLPEERLFSAARRPVFRL